MGGGGRGWCRKYGDFRLCIIFALPYYYRIRSNTNKTRIILKYCCTDLPAILGIDYFFTIPKNIYQTFNGYSLTDGNVIIQVCPVRLYSYTPRPTSPAIRPYFNIYI